MNEPKLYSQDSFKFLLSIGKCLHRWPATFSLGGNRTIWSSSFQDLIHSHLMGGRIESLTISLYTFSIVNFPKITPVVCEWWGCRTCTNFLFKIKIKINIKPFSSFFFKYKRSINGIELLIEHCYPHTINITCFLSSSSEHWSSYFNYYYFFFFY